MAKPKSQNRTNARAQPKQRIPNFGAEAALGPASRIYRSPMEGYPGMASGAVMPSYLGSDALGEEVDTEETDIEDDEADEVTGELGTDETDETDDDDDDDDDDAEG